MTLLHLLFIAVNIKLFCMMHGTAQDIWFDMSIANFSHDDYITESSIPMVPMSMVNGSVSVSQSFQLNRFAMYMCFDIYGTSGTALREPIIQYTQQDGSQSYPSLWYANQAQLGLTNYIVPSFFADNSSSAQVSNPTDNTYCILATYAFPSDFAGESENAQFFLLNPISTTYIPLSAQATTQAGSLQIGGDFLFPDLGIIRLVVGTFTDDTAAAFQAYVQYTTLDQVILHDLSASLTTQNFVLIYNQTYPQTSLISASDDFWSCFQIENDGVALSEADLPLNFSQLSLIMNLDCSLRNPSFVVWNNGTNSNVEASVFTDYVIILNDTVSQNVANTSRIQIGNWTISQNSTQYFPITSVQITELPQTGSLWLSSSSQILASNLPFTIDLSTTPVWYSPAFESCSFTNSLPLPCPLQPLGFDSFNEDQMTTVATNSHGQTSSSISHTFNVATALYSGQTLSNSVGAGLMLQLSFPSWSTALEQSILDNYAVIIHSIPSIGQLSCIPFTTDGNGSAQNLSSSTALPFVANNSAACSYLADTYSTNTSIPYSSFQWTLSHRTQYIGSTSISSTDVYSFRVNQAPKITWNSTNDEYWAAVSFSVALNVSIVDPDWGLTSVSSQSTYNVTVLSENDRIHLYAGPILSNSSRILLNSNTQIVFLCNKSDINTFLNDIQAVGSDAAVAYISLTVTDNDPSCWSGYTPVVSSKLEAHIVAAATVGSTTKSANDVIRNNAILLSVCIGVPVILLIIVALLCFRRYHRRKELEKRRQDLIKAKQSEMNAAIIQQQSAFQEASDFDGSDNETHSNSNCDNSYAPQSQSRTQKSSHVTKSQLSSRQSTQHSDSELSSDSDSDLSESKNSCDDLEPKEIDDSPAYQGSIHPPTYSEVHYS